jgi:hypothetical protein
MEAKLSKILLHLISQLTGGGHTVDKGGIKEEGVKGFFSKNRKFIFYF